jgi:hypothetical protein
MTEGAALEIELSQDPGDSHAPDVLLEGVDIEDRERSGGRAPACPPEPRAGFVKDS